MTVHDSDTIIKFIIALMIFESPLEVECECDQDAAKLDVALTGDHRGVRQGSPEPRILGEFATCADVDNRDRSAHISIRASEQPAGRNILWIDIE